MPVHKTNRFSYIKITKMEPYVPKSPEHNQQTKENISNKYFYWKPSLICRVQNKTKAKT